MHGPTVLQAADILTKPFTNADKWKRAVRLMAISPRAPTRNAAIARPGDGNSKTEYSSGEPEAEPEAQRLLVELCCSEESKLGDMSRKAALGCKIMRVTEKDNLNSPACQRRIRTGIKKFLRTHKPNDVMIWVSRGALHGRQMPSGKARIRRHVREFNKLWKSLVATIESIDEPITIAIEWPKGCTYWRLSKVRRFLDQYNLRTVLRWLPTQSSQPQQHAHQEALDNRNKQQYSS